MLDGKQRILIVGCGGSGKSTLAKKLGAVLDLPVVHLDQHFWRPGWRQTPEDEWNAVVDALLDRPAWVMDGNYSGTFAKRLARADAVVFLDFPRWASMAGVFQRWLQYRGRARPDLAAGCPERMDLEFLAFVWHFARDTRPRVVATLEEHAEGKEVHVLRSRAEIDGLLSAVRRIDRG